jgi:hypothetical protein
MKDTIEQSEPAKDSQVYSGMVDHLESDAEAEVEANEDASLPDKEYAFGEDNTDNEEYHDADDDSGLDLVDLFDEQSDERLDD